jgi:hypothetical protein
MVFAVAMVSITSQVSAAVVEFDITGQGTGTLDGVAWAGTFDIEMIGDNSTVTNSGAFSAIDPLASASVIITGVGTATLSDPTRLGLNSTNNAIFFGKSGSLDYFDFTLSPTDAAAFQFQAGYGPVNGTGVFALNQFANVATSLGLLTFSGSSDVSFSSVPAPNPIPGTGLLSFLALGLLGLCSAGWKRFRQGPAESGNRKPAEVVGGGLHSGTASYLFRLRRRRFKPVAPSPTNPIAT